MKKRDEFFGKNAGNNAAISETKPLPIDRWLASSALQKSIRRGDVNTALRSAMTFWLADRSAFWRRAAVIVLEDIGIASADVIVSVLSAANDAERRTQRQNPDFALSIVRLMCLATKTRVADSIVSICANAPDYKAYREALAKANHQTLADIALHAATPLPERAAALWFLAGTNRYRHDNLPVRPGCLNTALEVLKALDAPDDLTQYCISTLNKTPHPLAVLTPLLWIQLRRTTGKAFENPITPPLYIDGVPHYAADMFTRLGKTCIRQLQGKVPDVRQFTTKQIGLAMFYMEGALLDKELTGKRLQAFRQAGEIADIEDAGLCIPRYMGLRECLDRNWDLLADVRSLALRQAVTDWNSEQGEW